MPPGPIAERRVDRGDPQPRHHAPVAIVDIGRTGELAREHGAGRARTGLLGGPGRSPR
jgi:hypothetical protein